MSDETLMRIASLIDSKFPSATVELDEYGQLVVWVDDE